MSRKSGACEAPYPTVRNAACYEAAEICSSSARSSGGGGSLTSRKALRVVAYFSCVERSAVSEMEACDSSATESKRRAAGGAGAHVGAQRAIDEGDDLQVWRVG